MFVPKRDVKLQLTHLLTLFRSTSPDFNEARDDGVAVASRGTYANHLHLAPDASTSSFKFYRPDVLSDAKPTVSKH